MVHISLSHGTLLIKEESQACEERARCVSLCMCVCCGARVAAAACLSERGACMLNI